MENIRSYKVVAASGVLGTSPIMEQAVGAGNGYAVSLGDPVPVNQMEGIEKVMMDVEGKFWTRQNEMVGELESLDYEVLEISGEHLVVVDLQDEAETEYTLRIGCANHTMWIMSVK